MRADFEINKSKLEELIRVNHNNFESAKEIVGYIDQHSPSDEIEFSGLIVKSFAYDIAYNQNNSLLTELIQSGSLKDISNTELRKKLTNWLSTLEDFASEEKNLELQR